MDVRLSSLAGAITGRILQPDGVTGVPFAELQFLLLDGDFVSGIRADGDGFFDTGMRLAPGGYLVKAGSQFGGAGGFGFVFFVTAGQVGAVSRFDATLVNVADNAATGGVVFRLPVAGRITGQITNGSFGLDGALVGVVDLASGTFIVQAITDAGGNYDTGFFLAPGTYRVDAFLPGFIQKSSGPVTVNGSQTTGGADVALDPAGQIAGRVTQADGITPIVGALVEAHPLDGGTFGSAFTASDGTYTIDGLATDTYRVVALAENFANRWYNDKPDMAQADFVAVVTGATTPNINFALSAGAGAILGRVTQADGVTPIPFASVQINLASGGFGVMFLGADASGNYTTGRRLAPGSYTVQAQPDGFVRTWFSNRFTSSTADPVAVVAAADTPGINFALEIAGGITGRVTCLTPAPPICAAAGDPIPGAIIDVFETGTNAFVVGGFGGMITDSGGNYSTGRVLPPGITYTVKARFPGARFVETFHARAADFGADFVTLGVDFTTASSIPVVAGADTTGRDIAAPLGGEISGTIRDKSTGLPIQNASVFVGRFEASNFFGSFSAQTDAGGNYRFRGLRDGDWLVEVHVPGYIHGFWSGDPDSPAPDQGIQQVIRIAGANVVGGVDMNLTPGGGAVQGRVLRSDNGQPIPSGTTVQARGLFPRSSGVATTTTDAAGNYTIAGLGTGQYTIEVRGRQFAGGTAIGWFPAQATSRATALPVSVTDGQTTIVPDFTVPGFPGGQSPRTISGTLRDVAGNRLAFAAAIALDRDTGNTVRFITTNGNGTYTINTLPSRRFIVLAETETTFERRFFGPTPGGEPFFGAAQPVDVTAANAAAIDIRLPATAGTVSGLVTRRDNGQPVVGASVQVRNALNNFVLGTGTVQDGTFIIRGVPPGQYRLRVTGIGLVPRFFTTAGTGGLTFNDGDFIVVVSGQDTGGIDVPVDEGAGSISGTVRREGTLEPLVGASLDAFSDRFLTSAITRADGTYRIDGIGTGGYTLRAFASGHATQWSSGQDSQATADPVGVIGANNTNNVDFLLSTSQGSISGTAFQSDGVTPLAGVSVQAFDAVTGGFVVGGGPPARSGATPSRVWLPAWTATSSWRAPSASRGSSSTTPSRSRRRRRSLSLMTQTPRT